MVSRGRTFTGYERALFRCWRDHVLQSRSNRASHKHERDSSVENQDTNRQAIQPVFRDGEAKLLEVLRGIGEAPLIRHAQRPMNVSEAKQELNDVEQRGLDGDAIRPHRFG